MVFSGTITDSPFKFIEGYPQTKKDEVQIRQTPFMIVIPRDDYC